MKICGGQSMKGIAALFFCRTKAGEIYLSFCGSRPSRLPQHRSVEAPSPGDPARQREKTFAWPALLLSWCKVLRRKRSDSSRRWWLAPNGSHTPQPIDRCGAPVNLKAKKNNHSAFRTSTTMAIWRVRRLQPKIHLPMHLVQVAGSYVVVLTKTEATSEFDFRQSKRSTLRQRGHVKP